MTITGDSTAGRILEAGRQLIMRRGYSGFSYADIADAIGVSNVHVNRVLQDLRGQGLLTLQGQRLVIHDWPLLTKRAEFDPAYLHLKRPAIP